MPPTLTTERLVLRGWRVDDAAAALRIYGDRDVTRWLSPAIERVPDIEAMQGILGDWIDDDSPGDGPSGRWAIERRADGQLVGGVVLLPLPPRGDDLEIGWQLPPQMWGYGYASESSRAIADWAFGQGLEELFAVVRPNNTRAAAVAHRNGMEWVGETDKYFGMTLQVYRLRPGPHDPPGSAVR